MNRQSSKPNDPGDNKGISKEIEEIGAFQKTIRRATERNREKVTRPNGRTDKGLPKSIKNINHGSVILPFVNIVVEKRLELSMKHEEQPNQIDQEDKAEDGENADKPTINGG
jgi:hypothetical protein